MAQYKIRVRYRSHEEDQIFPTLGGALYEALKIEQIDKEARNITVLRDSQGEDHPDNAGKFFLYHIVK